MRQFYNILSDEQINKVHMASLQVAEEVGMEVEAESALKELSDKGIKVDFDKNRVYFTAEQIEKAIALAPSTIPCGSRDGNLIW